MSAQGKPLRCEIIHDNFQNYKKYNVAKAQLVIADIPYNIGTDAYGSNPTSPSTTTLSLSTPTEKASSRKELFSIRTVISRSQSICTSVQGC